MLAMSPSNRKGCDSFVPEYYQKPLQNDSPIAMTRIVARGNPRARNEASPCDDIER